MDSESFRIYGKQMVDFVADYWESLDATNGDRNPLPSNIHPGFIWKLVTGTIQHTIYYLYQKC